MNIHIVTSHHYHYHYDYHYGYLLSLWILLNIYYLIVNIYSDS